MNSDIIKGKWKQFHGEMKQKWGKLTDDELDKMDGRREELAGIIQEKYGYARDRAKREVDDFFDSRN